MANQLVSDLKNFGTALLVSFVIFFVVTMPVTILAVLLFIDGCRNRVIDRIADLSGLDFEVASRECLPKEASISVFISKRGMGKKERIFWYDAVFDDINKQFIKPSISVNGENIIIAVEKFYDIYSKKENWNNYVINYRLNEKT